MHTLSGHTDGTSVSSQVCFFTRLVLGPVKPRVFMTWDLGPVGSTNKTVVFCNRVKASVTPSRVLCGLCGCLSGLQLGQTCLLGGLTHHPPPLPTPPPPPHLPPTRPLIPATRDIPDTSRKTSQNQPPLS